MNILTYKFDIYTLMNTYFCILFFTCITISYGLYSKKKISSLEEKNSLLEITLKEQSFILNNIREELNVLKESLKKDSLKNEYTNKKYFDTIIKDIRHDIQEKYTKIFTDITQLNSRIDKVVKNDQTCDKIVIKNDADKESVLGVLNNEINILKEQYSSVYESISQSTAMFINYDNVFSNLKFEVDKLKTSLNYYTNMIKTHDYTIAFVNNTLLNEIVSIKNFISVTNIVTMMKNIINEILDERSDKIITRKTVEFMIDQKINTITVMLHKNWLCLKDMCKLFKLGSSVRIEILFWSVKNKNKIISMFDKSEYEKTEYYARILKNFIEYNKYTDLLYVWDYLKNDNFTPEQNNALKNMYPKIQ